jgi:hypothetical protein
LPAIGQYRTSWPQLAAIGGQLGLIGNRLATVGNDWTVIECYWEKTDWRDTPCCRATPWHVPTSSVVPNECERGGFGRDQQLYSWPRKKYEIQRTKYKRKWEGQSSKDEQRPARPKLCTSSFVSRTLNCSPVTNITRFRDRLTSQWLIAAKSLLKNQTK